jgi:uncharacterized protein YndB with AHSA1/START domain
MNESATGSIVVERKLAHPPEKVWRALTDAPLIEQWLMKSDFVARLGARFSFQAKPMGDWDGIVYCEITRFEPPQCLAYTWKGGAATNSGYGSLLDTVVEWTLTPEPDGTRLRMEHSGFQPHNATAHDAMSGGWRQVIERLEALLKRMDQ